MREEELLKQIKESADDIVVPASLAPERVIGSLRRANAPGSRHFSPRRAASAAAVFLLCFALSGVAWNAAKTAPPLSGHSPAPLESAEGIKEGTEEPAQNIEEPKQNAGNLYTVAKSYDEVYDMLESSYSAYYNTCEYDGITADGEDEIARTEGALDLKLYSAASLDNGASKKESSTENYSKTNLQTEGVDESDRIKTDGRYIYTVKGQKVLITDTAKEGLAPAGSVTPKMDPADSVLELYVDNGTLLLLAQHYDSSLEEAMPEDTEVSTKESSYVGEDYVTDTDSGFIPLEENAKIRSIQTNYSVTLYVYDVSDPSRPVLSGSVSQDGFYKTSRKIGDMLYLFTTKDELANASFERGGHDGILPCIDGKEIPYDHIYLPSTGNDGLVISSIDVRHPDEIVDQLMIVHDYADIYVGNDSIYLYHADYKANDTLTSIAKFGIDNGKINAVDAVSVKGEIYDTFAIQEYRNTLRVLTTSSDYNGTTENHLFLFDEDLSLTGSLDGIARGEEIYAARYFENTAYFITYRNTDPLFAVDLTDTTNPALLGQLEITGFSEYLHFWGNDKLFGIGYETDPDSGETKGLKLVMFDISNPADLKILDSLVLKEYYYSPALYQYKCALADPDKNLIGFAAERDPRDGYLTEYNVYAWENGHFTEKLRSKLPEHGSSDEARGLYIEDKFFVADTTEIAEFSMNEGFQEKNRLQLEE